MLKGYRTIIFNILAGGLALASTRFGLNLDPQTQVDAVSAVLTIGNIALRVVTDSKVGTK
jgi:hypothetical protein